MCLTIPGRIARIEGNEATGRTAVVDYDGLIRTVSLLYLPEARVGEYVMVHAGFATGRVSEAEAREALGYARDMLRPRARTPKAPGAPAEA